MPSIGVNLRVTGHCSQGGRKYMEDFFSVAYQQGLADERDFEYAFIGIYDGLYLCLHNFRPKQNINTTFHLTIFIDTCF